MDYCKIDYLTKKICDSNELIWVNPVGGLGDIIMLSSAIKKSYDKYGKKFNIVRRAIYTEFFSNHPAVNIIGNPPVGSKILCNDYWSRKEFENPLTKSYDIVLKIFGITDNSDRELFVSMPENCNTQLLINSIPWETKNVAICVSSESPRKEMHPYKWHIIVEKLLSQHCFVVQVGRMEDFYIKGAYSLLGCTTPGQVFEILKKVDVVITLDNFVMHAAQAAAVPAVTLFGPTESSRYAYCDELSFQSNIDLCPDKDKCLGPQFAENYKEYCPYFEQHCMNQFNENSIVDVVMSIIKVK